FSGVKRRFTEVDVINSVRIIDDYGHHPVEIAAVLKAARSVTQGRVIAVVQPHRYSRVRDLWHEFSGCLFDADTVLLAPIYEAGEAPLEGITHTALADAIRSHGHKDVSVTNETDLAADLKPRIKPGDIVVCLGAGSITHWAAGLAERLKTLTK
ncbi:MAG: glutamate ligase domain-containing protein, partial [Holosporales bacterium]